MLLSSAPSFGAKLLWELHPGLAGYHAFGTATLMTAAASPSTQAEHDASIEARPSKRYFPSRAGPPAAGESAVTQLDSAQDMQRGFMVDWHEERLMDNAQDEQGWVQYACEVLLFGSRGGVITGEQL